MLVSVDPSFRRSGIFVKSSLGSDILGDKWYKDSEFLYQYFSIGRKMLSKSFGGIYQSVMLLRQDFRDLLEKLNFSEGVDTLVMEYPPPRSFFSAGLYMLDGMFMEEFSRWFDVGYIVYPGAINRHIGKKRVKKNEIVDYVKREFVGVPEKINHDEASALILYKIVSDRLTGVSAKPVIYKVDFGLVYESSQFYVKL